MTVFDIVVIGAGPAGVSAALRAADNGARVCVVEQKRIGSSCFYKGLYPFKAALTILRDGKSDLLRDGVIDIGKLLRSVEKSISLITQKWETSLAELGVEIFFGAGIPLSSELIQVKSEEKLSEICTKKIIIATGSYPIPIPTLPFEKDNIISADDVFQSNTIPKTVLVMGSESYGCEIASFYQRLGSKVFLSNHGSRLLADQDPDVIDAVENYFKKIKVKLLLDKRLSSYYKNNGLFDITLSGGVKFQAERIVQNLNREGRSLNLRCEKLGIRLGECKEILVNENFETSSENIYAVGSVTGRTTTPGISEEEGKVAADNAMGKNKLLNCDWTPFMIFTKPEVACVGCFTKEAHYKGFRAVEGKINSDNLDFGILNNTTGGFFKIIADARSGMVIGGQIISPNASQLISIVLMAIKKGIKVGALAALVCDKSGEIQGIKEAARACSRALKDQQKNLKSN